MTIKSHKGLRNGALIVVSVLALAGVALWQAFKPFSYPSDLRPTFADVAYAGRSPSEVLDLFLPKGDGPFPLLINIHGGGFMFGSKEMLDAPIARELLAKGIAVASINYRLSGEAKFPAAVQDVKAAVRFLRANAEAYKLKPDRFIAFGQSAGGNLASMLGTTADVAEFDDAGLGNATVPGRVQGVIDWFGPTDFLLMDEQAKAQGCPADHGKAGSPESAYLGAPVATVPALARKSNPIEAINANTPPFLIEKGDKDCSVPVAQSELLANALKASGVPIEFAVLKGAGHGDGPFGSPRFLSAENITRVVGFVERLTH
jgi:acetyl esterase/lipase